MATSTDFPDDAFSHPDLAPIRALLTDPTVLRVSVEPTGRVTFERDADLVVHTEAYDVGAVSSAADALLAVAGVTPSSKFTAAEFSVDGSTFRLSVVSPPLGCSFVVSRFVPAPRSLEALSGVGFMDDEVSRFLSHAASSGLSILVAGGPGTGKTTLLNALVAALNPSTRCIVAESEEELKVSAVHFVGGKMSLAELLREALRMRPQALVAGEIRTGPEAHALRRHTGQRLSAVQAASPENALERFRDLVEDGTFDTSPGFDLLVYVTMEGRRRQVRSVHQIVSENRQSTLRTLFAYEDGRFVHHGDLTRAVRRRLTALRPPREALPAVPRSLEPLTAAEASGVTFSTSKDGYDRCEVDAFAERAAERLRELEAANARQEALLRHLRDLLGDSEA